MENLLKKYEIVLSESLVSMRKESVTNKIIKTDTCFIMISEGLISYERIIFLIFRDLSMNLLSIYKKFEKGEYLEITPSNFLKVLPDISNIKSMYFENEASLEKDESFNENITKKDLTYPSWGIFFENSKLSSRDLFKSNCLEYYLNKFSFNIYDPIKEKKCFKGQANFLFSLLLKLKLSEDKKIIDFLALLIKSSDFKMLKLLEDLISGTLNAPNAENRRYYLESVLFPTIKITIENNYMEKENNKKYLEKNPEIKKNSIINLKAIEVVFRYLIEHPLFNSKYFEEVLTSYFDYLNMSFDMKKLNDATRINFKPFDVFIAHDKMVSIYKVLKSEIEDLNIMSRYKEDTIIGNYVVMFPKSVQDFIDEGKSLGHCVGSYAKRHADKKTTVVFIRELTNPEKSFFTLEYKEGKIYQLRGRFNKSSTEKIEEVSLKFLKIIEKEAEVEEEDLAC